MSYADADDARALLSEIVTSDDLANAPDENAPCDDSADGRHLFQSHTVDYDRCRECGALRATP